MRVICVSDSLGLPREECPYENTWLYKLKKKFPAYEFIDYFERRLHVTKALSNYDSYYTFYSPEIVIIQFGICDCSPRYIDEEKLGIRIIIGICRRLGLLDFFWKIVKLRGRSSTRVDTPIDIFSLRFEQLLSKFIKGGAKHIILIKIGHVAESVVKKNKHINENVEKYNLELERLKGLRPGAITIVDPLGKVDETLFVDGYHCNPKGMEIVYNCLRVELEKFCKDV